MVEQSEPLVEAGVWVGAAASAVGGWIGVVGLVGLPARNLPFMSGNTAEFGDRVAKGSWLEAAVIASIYAAYLVGVVSGELAGGSLPRRRVALLLAEAGLLALGGLARLAGAPTPVVPDVLGFAMGWLTAAIHEAGNVRAGLTYVTGTTVSAGRVIAASLRGRGSFAALRPHAALWSGFAAGGLAGGLLMRLSFAAAVFGAAGWALALSLWCARDARR